MIFRISGSTVAIKTDGLTDLAEFTRGDSTGTGLIPQISDGIISVTLSP
jgi:hypothetical protein